MDIQPSQSARWFSRVMWVGIAANLVLAIPTLLLPEHMMALTGIPAASPLLWPQFSALLLILLSIFYVPAARSRHGTGSSPGWPSASRLAGVIFFLGFQPREYRMLGYFDFVFFVPEAGAADAGARASHGANDRRRCRRWRTP